MRRSVRLAEVDVALTDFAIALECAILTVLLFRGTAARPALRRLFAIFFAATGTAALLGGIVHGFVTDETAIARAVTWRLTMLAIGAATFGAAAIGGRLLFSERNAQGLQRIAGWLLAAYAVVVVAIDQRFSIAIAFYAPAVALLGGAFLVRRSVAGLAGVVLTLVAAVVQQMKIGLLPLHLTHNAVYHLIQMLALALIYVAGRRIDRGIP